MAMPQGTAEQKRGTWKMVLEELIYKRFAGSEGLARHLAVFNGMPAIFSQEPPDGSQEGWGSPAHYPRAVYGFDMQANNERHSAGTLSVSLLCQNTTDSTPEIIEPYIRACLRDVLLKPDGGTPYCFTWAGTDSFTIEEKRGIITTGCETRFDILEYPQETTGPVPAVCQYIKGLYPGSLVIGHDRLEEITEASDARPVIYCRLLSSDKAEETNTVAWMDSRIAVHVLCPGNSRRMEIAAGIGNSLSLAGGITMPDKSPMFIKRLQTDYGADYLKEGQVILTGHYGILRGFAAGHRLKRARTAIKNKTGGNYMAQGQKNKEGQETGTENKKRPGSGTSVYTAAELTANAQAVFGTVPDIVSAALRQEGITECTKEEAKKIIQDFVKREV